MKFVITNKPDDFIDTPTLLFPSSQRISGNAENILRKKQTNKQNISILGEAM